MLHYLHVPLLRRLGKRMVFVFNGSDARPPYINGARMAPDRAMPTADCLAMTHRMKTSIAKIERHADAIVAQPAFSHFFERPVVNGVKQCPTRWLEGAGGGPTARPRRG